MLALDLQSGLHNLRHTSGKMCEYLIWGDKPYALVNSGGFFIAEHTIKHSVNNQQKVIAMLISIIVSLVVLGLLLWLIDFLPIDGRIKQIIHVLAIVAVVLWLISILLGNGTAMPLMR